jgi:hypothetical protein
LSWRQYHVLETPDELKISVRFLHPGMTAVMLSVLAIFWSVLLFTNGASPALLVLMCVTSLVAWVISFGKTWVSLKPGRLTTYSAPIPFDRSIRNPSDLEDLSCMLVRAPAGRGGISERYSVVARSRSGGNKPIAILYGFVKEDDARQVARLLMGRLNSLRPPYANPVTVTER